MLESFYLRNEVVVEGQRSEVYQPVQSLNFGDGVVVEPQGHQIMVLRDGLWHYLGESFVLKIQLVVKLRSRKQSFLLAVVFESPRSHQRVRTRVHIDTPFLLVFF
jgi:hypothetical protein